MSRHFLRPMIIGATLLVLLVVTALPTEAATHQHSVANPSRSLYAAQHATTGKADSHSVAIGSSGSAHYLYVEDGTNPDSIDVWKTGGSLTHVGNYPTNAKNSGGAYYGANRLAIVKSQSGNNCLLLADTNNFSPPGYLDSFPINLNGSLGAEVGHVEMKGGGNPDQVQAVGTSNMAVVNVPGSELDSFSVGTGCTLTLLSSTNTHGGAAPTLIAICFFWGIICIIFAAIPGTNSLDLYSIASDGSMAFMRSNPAQVSGCPEGMAGAVMGNNALTVFTGQCTGGAPQAEGGTVNTNTGVISYLRGSPASDPGGKNGAAVWFDATDGLLIQGEQSSSSLGVYSVANGGLSFMMHAALAESSAAPSAFAQSGQTLYIDTTNNGDVEACTLSKSGASGCATVATLTNTGGSSSGIAVL